MTFSLALYAGWRVGVQGDQAEAFVCVCALRPAAALLGGGGRASSCFLSVPDSSGVPHGGPVEPSMSLYCVPLPLVSNFLCGKNIGIGVLNLRATVGGW